MRSTSSCSVASNVEARRREEDEWSAEEGFVETPRSAATERSDSLIEREKREGGCELRVSGVRGGHSLTKTVW